MCRKKVKQGTSTQREENIHLMSYAHHPAHNFNKMLEFQIIAVPVGSYTV